MFDYNDQRTLTVAYYDEDTSHTVTLRNDELNNLIDVLERLIPVIHSAGFPQTKMKIDGDENIVFYTDERGFFDEEETRFWEAVCEAEKALYEEETTDYWPDAFDADVSKKASFTVGDRVQNTGDEHREDLKGQVGTIVIVEGTIALVEYDNWFKGHNDDGTGNKTGGPENRWWSPTRDFTKVKPKASLQAGDEVIYTGKGEGDPITGHNGYKGVSLIGKVGWVVKAHDDYDYLYLVEFYDWFDGHDGDDQGGTSCWWVTAYDIEEYF